ncbi:MAG: excinuclease ABC subunit UvrA [Clostridia bacterium]|nr:excinuclease ABC subunit UvrA [Clostridia bacterium]MBN2883191.1 excinuclease ABC subunit UvrA [Clostridia bacterium]
MKNDYIHVKGAKEHNLKNIDVKIPRDKLVVVTGISGSGKSSLAFDTIYAEGQRRYVESLSAYARQFLGQMNKPDVEFIEGLSPAISIDQKTTSRNPRSTVGTVTEIHDYLRLLFARIGIPHCTVCGREIASTSIDQITDSIMQLEDGTKILIVSPVVRARKGEYDKFIKQILKDGFTRVIIDGKNYDLTTDEIKLEKQIKHDIAIIVDRLVVKEGIENRLTDSLETALKRSDGLVKIVQEDGREKLYSQNLSCPEHDFSIGELSPRMFSFNSPFGACPECSGLGVHLEMDPDLIIPDKSLSLTKGAVKVAGFSYNEDSWSRSFLDAIGKHYKVNMDQPFEDLPDEVKNVILFGSGNVKFKIKYSNSRLSYSSDERTEGIVNVVKRRYMQTKSNHMKRYYEGFMSANPCNVCKGSRFKPEVLAVTVGDLNIYDISKMSIEDCLYFFENLRLDATRTMISDLVIKEIKERLNFLVNVGLDYLTLSRTASTLSGGEAQRIRLATQIGSGLMGVLYILDEPSIGLHQRDNKKLLETLKKMRDLGNTLIVVEHDNETISEADYIIDMGPGAGVHGGEVVCQGTPEDILMCDKSETGLYMSGKKAIIIPENRRKSNGKHLIIRGAEQNNLKKIDVDFPLGIFICVTGVSGSGKSSLITEILYKELAGRINKAKLKSGKHRSIDGLEYIDKVIDIDQSPIGRTPRSNPATYTKVFDEIRDVFALTRDARSRGYKKGRFSFNVPGGRCESCKGDGIKKIEMHFLPDVYVPCEVCKGKRYNRETLEIKYKGKNISEVLDMTVETAMEFFQNIPNIYRKLNLLYEVGLGYIKVGQPSTTLSGGEAQRIKLSAELSKRSTGNTIYILDEPTTGLHTADVHKLLDIINRLVDSGNSVVIIEHNLDVIKCADYVIDLGPEGGQKGGEIVASGTPEEISAIDGSYTGKFLKNVLNDRLPKG